MKNSREIVGYISTYGKTNGVSVQIQKQMIDRYCQSNHVICSQIFMDVGQRANRDEEGRKRAELLGLSSKKWSIMYEQWEKMLLKIKEGKIGTILVDSRVRVQGIGVERKRVFQSLIQKYDVKVIDVGEYIPPQEDKKEKAIIYTFLKEDESSVIQIKNIDAYYQAAVHHGWAVAALYIDKGLQHGNKHQKMRQNCMERKCHAVIVHSAFYLNRNAGEFFQNLIDFKEKGITLYSLKEGMICAADKEDYFFKPLRIAVYDAAESRTQEMFQDLLQERAEVFCKLRTNWKIKGWYMEEKGEKERKALGNLENHIEEYDLILIDNVRSLNKWTCHIFKIWERLDRKPIFYMSKGEIVTWMKE